MTLRIESRRAEKVEKVSGPPTWSSGTHVLWLSRDYPPELRLEHSEVGRDQKKMVCGVDGRPRWGHVRMQLGFYHSSKNWVCGSREIEEGPKAAFLIFWQIWPCSFTITLNRRLIFLLKWL